MTQTASSSPVGARSMRLHGSLAVPCRIGRWELVRLAAHGSLARVFRARPADSPADRPASYALKVLWPRWQDDPRAVRLLAREALVGRSVSHPHLIPILGAALDRPPQFVVMPYLEGSTLREQLAAGYCFDVPEALWIARQTAEALEALHAAGWRHGDVKPGNLFLSPEDHVTLLDLGFARRADETGSAVERCVLGTCQYLAPEMIVSALAADVRSDIYSLGVVLFELLAGRLPFPARDLADLAMAHCRAVPPELQRLAPHVPPEVTELVRRMLAKDPLRRPGTPRELVDVLASLEIATFSERSWA